MLTNQIWPTSLSAAIVFRVHPFLVKAPGAPVFGHCPKKTRAVAGMGWGAIVETRTMQTLKLTCRLDIRLIGVSGRAIVE